MRRLALTVVCLLALAAPGAALALPNAPGDGTLVIRNGQGTAATPVVTLVINGTVLGHVQGGPARLVITDLNSNDGFNPEVAGFGLRRDLSDTTTKWIGNDFKFRAVGVGTYVRITVYGSDVDLVAVGHGKVMLAGSPDAGATDGGYSFNGNAFRSLPGEQTDWLPLAGEIG